MSKKKDNLEPVQFRMSPEEIARIDRLAEKGGLTRSQFLRNLVVVGLEETETMEKLGLVRATITVRDICYWMSMKVTQSISGDLDQDNVKQVN